MIENVNNGLPQEKGPTNYQVIVDLTENTPTRLAGMIANQEGNFHRGLISFFTAFVSTAELMQEDGEVTADYIVRIEEVKRELLEKSLKIHSDPDDAHLDEARKAEIKAVEDEIIREIGYLQPRVDELL